MSVKCAYWNYPPNKYWYWRRVMCAYSRSNGDIEVRIEHYVAEPFHDWSTDWEMRIYREVSPNNWKLGGTRTGYVSMASPSRRIFTNCKPGRWMIRVDYKDDYAGRMPQQQVVFLNHLI